MRYEQKDELDRFYTSREVAARCVSVLDLSQYDLIVEPSAGDGAFVDVLPRCVAIDISPGRSDILTQDFFTLSIYTEAERVLVVGNPPFGKQNSLALKFINHAVGIADTVAFVLPMSFMKPSVQNKVHRSLHLVSVVELPKNSFVFDGRPYDVPCVFQVWKKGSVRELLVPEPPVGFAYVDASEANVCIRRVGYYAGRACTDMTKNKESHLFINVKDHSRIDRVVNGLNEQKWDHKNTVGPRTVSKFDLNPVINLSLFS